MRSRIIFATVLLIAFSTQYTAASTRWDEEYFPNSILITDSGEQVRFFDDLIKNKIVAILFIYTSCPDTCPLETAQMVKVQNILGDRVGRDVFFYSITIDPQVDTPEVLKQYKKRFGANWTFLTGNEDDIIEIRRKLGLYIEEIQDGSNNHNLNMIIGNQATGRWMKRSPFENPYVLADQIANWLPGWKSASVEKDYTNAPELRNISTGERLFRTRCQTCHTLDGREAEGAIGPDLLGVTFLRDQEWLLSWLKSPDDMIANKDPIAVSLFEEYNRVLMPNMRLTRNEAIELLQYIETVTRSKVDIAGLEENETQEVQMSVPVVNSPESSDIVAVMNAWIRIADPAAPANAGYMTLVNVGDEDLVLKAIESQDFGKVEVHEMAVVDGLRKMRRIEEIVVPARGQVALEPGGMHLMLMDRRIHLREGLPVDLKLIFSSGRTQSVSLQVASR